MKDLVLVSVANYEWEDIQPLIVSLEKSGYDGYVAVVAFEMKNDLIKKLAERKIIVVPTTKDLTPEGNILYSSVSPNYNICVDRFFWYHHIISTFPHPIKYVITVDAKDVIFQRNPSELLRRVRKDKQEEFIIVSGEGLAYKDEPWAIQNMSISFGPKAYDDIKEQEIYNAGVIAGTVKHLNEVFLNIALYCRGIVAHVPGGGGPDQAAYNVYLNSQKKLGAMNIKTENDWACQAGTTADPSKIDQFREKLLVKEPQWDGEYVCTPYKKYKYYIVHQYDRVPEWKKVILDKYKD